MRWTRRELLYAGGLGALATSGVVAFTDRAGASPPGRLDTGSAKLVGRPIHNVAINRAEMDRLPDGREVIYQGLSGQPAALAQVDVQTNAVLNVAALDGAESVWGMAVGMQADVYVAGSPNGHLYRVDPTGDSADDLGRVADSETFLYGLATDHDGRVYGGSYPNGLLWRYTPSTDRFDSYGQVRADSTYTRSLAVTDGQAYVGLGTVGAYLYEVDLETGERRQIPLPDPHANAAEISNVDVVLGRLFVRTSDSQLLVYDLDADDWVSDLGTSVGSTSSISPLGPGARVSYLDGDNRVVSYHVPTGELTRTNRTIDWTSKGFGWAALGGREFPARTLVMNDYIGRLWYDNPMTGNTRRTQPDLPGQPVQVHSLAGGPDGRVYASGYQSGGLASYDPSTQTMHQFPRGTVGQAEGMAAFRNRLYLGIYPDAVILEFDPELPFEYGTNPTILGPLGHEQDRPFAWSPVGETIGIGTVPTYGQRGGAISLLNPETKQVTVHRDVIPDHSVTALATVDDLLVGGTSVFPGLGIPPTDGDAYLFMWDPETQSRVWELIPIPGERAITDLAVGPSGHVFGVTVGKLFTFDPVSRTVLGVEDVASWPWDPGYSVWTSGVLDFGPDGFLYAQIYGTLYRIDPDSMERTELATEHVSQLAVTSSGSIYFTRSAAELYVLDAGAAAAPTGGATR